MNDHSKIPRDSHIVNGNNHVVKTKRQLEEFVEKDYNAECGAGFYAIQDIDIAKRYALDKVETYGGEPTLNLFKLNHDLITKDLSFAYFNSIEDPRTLEYLGGNINGTFPEHCKVNFEERTNKRPVDLCHVCHQECSWSADYVEAVLSDATYNLDDILLAYWNKKLSFQDALDKIYQRIDEMDERLRIQVALKGKILDIDHYNYLEYVDSVVFRND